MSSPDNTRATPNAPRLALPTRGKRCGCLPAGVACHGPSRRAPAVPASLWPSSCGGSPGAFPCLAAAVLPPQADNVTAPLSAFSCRFPSRGGIVFILLGVSPRAPRCLNVWYVGHSLLRAVLCSFYSVESNLLLETHCTCPPISAGWVNLSCLWCAAWCTRAVVCLSSIDVARQSTH